MTYDDVQAKNFREVPDRRTPTGWSWVARRARYFYAPDYRKITDKAVREALIWAIPYEDQILLARA